MIKKSTKKIAKAKHKLRKKKPAKTGIARSFGALKRGIDGLAYQKEARNEWEDFSLNLARFKKLTSKVKKSS